MLVLARKCGERIVIGAGQGQEVVLTIVGMRGRRVQLGVEADASISVRRVEPEHETQAGSDHPLRETHHVRGIAR